MKLKYDDPDKCPHPLLIGAKWNGSFTDEDVNVFVCQQCGIPFIGARVSKFKHNPEAKAFLKKMMDELVIEVPQIGPEVPVPLDVPKQIL